MSELILPTKSPEKNHTPPSNIEYFKGEYAISIQALLTSYQAYEGGKSFFKIETGNLATSSIMNAIEIKGNNQIKIVGFLNTIISKNITDSPDKIFDSYKEVLIRLSNDCKEKGKTLVLGFSSMGGYEILPRLSEIIKEIKANNKNIIFVIGGADFNNLPEKDVFDKVFSYGIDIVNIGGAGEFVDFIGDLSQNYGFYRDENGFLKVETQEKIPQNLLFAHQKDNIGEVKPGEKIQTTFNYNSFTSELRFTINNNPCLNNCSYCANHIHGSTPLADNDIENAISDFNKYTSSIDENDVSLTIGNPNPLQYTDKFERFLQNIDLSKVKIIGFFGDFLGMGNDKIYEKTIKIIDDLLQKWPQICISVHFGIDAMHHKGDGDFVGRTIGLKIAEEPKYTAGFKNFDMFYQKYLNNPRVQIPFNIIFHPNMELKDYKERLDLVEKYKRKTMGVGLYPLYPHPNTKIEQIHKGYFLPEHKLTENIDLVDNPKFGNVNFWGHFYLNSSLLDIFVLLGLTGFNEIFKTIVHNKIGKEKENEISFIHAMVFIGDIIGKKWDNNNSWKNKILHPIKCKKEQKYLKKVVGIIIKYINFMIYREEYICGINENYNSNEVKNFINKLKLLTNKFQEFQEILC